MFLGRVVGTCVATVKYPGLEGRRLLVVEPVDTKGPLRVTGAPFVAVDTVGAGPGEVVFWVGAREAALALEESFVPVDAAIVGLVDEVHRPDGALTALVRDACRAHP
jgi:ethanolamine utilization protein EutN